MYLFVFLEIKNPDTRNSCIMKEGVARIVRQTCRVSFERGAGKNLTVCQGQNCRAIWLLMVDYQDMIFTLNDKSAGQVFLKASRQIYLLMRHQIDANRIARVARDERLTVR